VPLLSTSQLRTRLGLPRPSDRAQGAFRSQRRHLAHDARPGHRSTHRAQDRSRGDRHSKGRNARARRHGGLGWAWRSLHHHGYAPSPSPLTTDNDYEIRQLKLFQAMVEKGEPADDTADSRLHHSSITAYILLPLHPNRSRGSRASLQRRAQIAISIRGLPRGPRRHVPGSAGGVFRGDRDRRAPASALGDLDHDRVEFAGQFSKLYRASPNLMPRASP
jgi:hypothetical protein